jgi:hypothetical protein
VKGLNRKERRRELQKKQQEKPSTSLLNGALIDAVLAESGI